MIAVSRVPAANKNTPRDLRHPEITTPPEALQGIACILDRSDDTPLQRVLNAAVRVITGRPTRKFDGGLDQILAG